MMSEVVKRAGVVEWLMITIDPRVHKGEAKVAGRWWYGKAQEWSATRTKYQRQQWSEEAQRTKQWTKMERRGQRHRWVVSEARA
jgi:hypothetical protein